MSIWAANRWQSSAIPTYHESHPKPVSQFCAWKRPPLLFFSRPPATCPTISYFFPMPTPPSLNSSPCWWGSEAAGRVQGHWFAICISWAIGRERYRGPSPFGLVLSGGPISAPTSRAVERKLLFCGLTPWYGASLEDGKLSHRFALGMFEEKG